MQEDIKIESEGQEQNFEDKLKKLKEKLKKCQEEKDEYLNGWQRAKADFINYKKGEEKKRVEFVKFANSLLASDILLVLDSFELAMKNIENPTKTEEGFCLIKEQLSDILKKYGLTEIKTLNEKFNPQFHEAIEEAESEKESGFIIEEMQKGYLLHGQILRVAKVKIAK